MAREGELAEREAAAREALREAAAQKLREEAARRRRNEAREAANAAALQRKVLRRSASHVFPAVVLQARGEVKLCTFPSAADECLPIRSAVTGPQCKDMPRLSP